MKILHAVECAFYSALLPDLTSFLQDIIPNRNFDVRDANFYHDNPGGGEKSTSLMRYEEARHQCTNGCLLDISEFVIQEMSVGFKGFFQNFNTMLQGNFQPKSWRNFGFAPIYNTLIKLRSIQSQMPNQTSESTVFRGERNVSDDETYEYFRIEAGGGSGLGFQLFCDGAAVLSAGGGGGGQYQLFISDTIFVRMTSNSKFLSSRQLNDSLGGIEGGLHSLNFGGGGGGGIQFDESFTYRSRAAVDKSESEETDEPAIAPKWPSIGGGGGCGSCDVDKIEVVEPESDRKLFGSEPSDRKSKKRYLEKQFSKTNVSICSQSPEHIVCGGYSDMDSITRSDAAPNIAERFQTFFKFLSSNCQTLEVYGGGGGGGGTAECTVPVSFGYGFSFHYSSKLESNTFNATANATDFADTSDSVDTSDSTASSDSADSTSDFNGEGKLGIGYPPGTRALASSIHLMGRDDQYKYDIAGSLLHDASLSCGGYDNWCCVSTMSADRIKYCFAIESTGEEEAIEDEKENEDEDEEKEGEEHHSWSDTSSCKSIQEAPSRVTWLLSVTGCNGSISTVIEEPDAECPVGQNCTRDEGRDSYPFLLRNDSQDESVYYSFDALNRFQTCLVSYGTNSSNISAAGGNVMDFADYNWATYSSSLPLSTLINTSNVYIQEAMLFYSFPRNASSPNSTAAYCSLNANASVYSFPDDDYSVNQTYGGYYRNRYRNDNISDNIYNNSSQTVPLSYNTSGHNTTSDADIPILETPIESWKNLDGIPHPMFSTHKEESQTNIMRLSIACFISLHIILFVFRKIFEY